jgi:hypothetical protein
MPRFAKTTTQVANDYAKRLRQITVGHKLVREPPKPISARRQDRERSLCGYCKEPLPRKALKYCSRHCYLRYSVEIAKPIIKAQVRLAELREQGLTPGHGGYAAQKKGAVLAENNRRGITGRRASKVNGCKWVTRRGSL